MRRNRGKRRAFTLVEMLVVIAIIGILVSLLLPAVQYARETARRISCVNNQKNLALAMQGYHEARKRLPPAAVYVGNPLDPASYQWAEYDRTRHDYLDFPTDDFRDPGWGATWVTMLLPYVEQQNMYDKYNLKMPAGHPDNLAVVSMSLPLMICPSAGKTEPALYDEPADWFRVGNTFAKGNYAVNTGGAFANASRGPVGWENKVYRSPFAFRPEYGAKMADFTDGASNTIIISEILNVMESGGEDDTRGCWGRVGGATFSLHVGSLSRCINLIATPNPNFNADRCFRDCPIDCNPSSRIPCDDCPTAGDFGGIAARSEHTAGVNAALADGSVRFISNSIDPLVWQALLSLMAGDIVPNF